MAIAPPEVERATSFGLEPRVGGDDPLRGGMSVTSRTGFSKGSPRGGMLQLAAPRGWDRGGCGPLGAVVKTAL